MNNNRLMCLKDILNKQNLDCLLISDPSSIAYLVEKVIHPGERMLVLAVYAKKDPVFFLNRLFNVPEEFGFEKVWYDDTQNTTEILKPYLMDCSNVGVDKNLPCRFFIPLMDALKHIKFSVGSFAIDSLRMVKDEQEIQLMKKASEINDACMEEMFQSLKAGVTENEMRDLLKVFYRKKNASGFSFDPIVGYGPNGADGHHECDNTPLKKGDSIVVDMGCVYQGYCSDMTRTFFYQEVSKKQQEVYNLVLEANLAAQAIIKPGVRLCDIDKACRDVIEKAGYGKYFTHRTGHFIGREVHEYGDVSSSFEMEVEEGMIFSIEPGIYLEGEFGVRIEDLVLVTKDGCISLNNYPKDLKVIV